MWYRLEKFLCYNCFSEMDTEGTIPPDNDSPQPMGDPNIEVTTLLPLKSLPWCVCVCELDN